VSTFNEYLKNRCSHIETLLDRHLPPALPTANQLHEAMRYAVLGGGKRLRPLLVYLTGEALGVRVEALDLPACAVELIHAYSLVHDDLPAMDNDDLRRGKPTCHKAYDEATAILTGDALQSLAFDLLAKTTPLLSAEQSLHMLKTLAVASGSSGMAGGQALDLLAAGRPSDATSIERLYHLKTGALIRASVDMGLIAKQDATTNQKAALGEYAHCLGLAFQIHDDIQDIESDVATLGKTPGNDQKNQKPTYPAVMGITAAKAQVRLLQHQAKAALFCLDAPGNYLGQLLDHVLT
jgi:farnesyl diphosphate synthase